MRKGTICKGLWSWVVLAMCVLGFVFLPTPPLQLACVYVSTCVALATLEFEGNTASLSNKISPSAYTSACNAGHIWALNTWGHCQPGSSRLWIQWPSRSLPSTQQPVLFWDIQGLHGFPLVVLDLSNSCLSRKVPNITYGMLEGFHPVCVFPVNSVLEMNLFSCTTD